MEEVGESRLPWYRDAVRLAILAAFAAGFYVVGDWLVRPGARKVPPATQVHQGRVHEPASSP